MRKEIFFAFFLIFLVISMIFVGGCKKETKETSEKEVEDTAKEMEGLINEIDQIDINVDLGNESLEEETNLVS